MKESHHIKSDLVYVLTNEVSLIKKRLKDRRDIHAIACSKVGGPFLINLKSARNLEVYLGCSPEASRLSADLIYINGFL